MAPNQNPKLELTGQLRGSKRTPTILAQKSRRFEFFSYLTLLFALVPIFSYLGY